MRLFPALLVAAFVLDGSLACADPDWKHGRPENQRAEHGSKGRHEEARVERPSFHSSDRVVIHEYIASRYRPHCPPGLAKKHNGCVPPGHIHHYVIGQPLPETIIYEPVPEELLMRLQPVPVGYRYVQVDNDVLLMAEASHEVIDAITLLSAVGH